MAKLGMPSVNIAFEEAGIEAIERSKRGIVALILEEPQDTITKLLTDHTGTDNSTIKAITNPFVIFTTDDIPSELTDNNKDYIKKCLMICTHYPGHINLNIKLNAWMLSYILRETSISFFPESVRYYNSRYISLRPVKIHQRKQIHLRSHNTSHSSFFQKSFP